MAVSLSGIFSGINTSSLISSIMQADSGALDSLQSQQTTIQSQQSAVKAIQSDLTQFQTVMNSLTGVSNLTSMSATSSDPSVSVTAGAGASAGSYNIVVNQLATAAQVIQSGVAQVETWTTNQGVATADSQFIPGDQISSDTGGNSQFSFQFGAEPAVTVDLSSYSGTGITLNQLVSQINAAAGYTAASAVDVNGQYELQLQAQSAGSGDALTISGANAVSALSSISDFSQTTAGQDEDNTLVGAGQFSYTYNGVARTFQTTATTTLGGLVNMINSDSANPGVTASILDYSVEPNQEFHLVLSGNNVGAGNNITINSATTIPGFGPSASNWTQTQQAQDSQFRINGYPSTDWIEQSSNTLTGVIPGATVTLEGENSSTGGATVTLSQDNSNVATALQNFVSVYNSLNTAISQYTGYNTSTNTGGVLQGNSTINSLMNALTNPLVTVLGGFGGQAYSMAAQIGLTLDSSGDGTLDLNTNTLNTALNTNSQNVLILIGAVGAGESDNSYIQFSGAAGTTAAGAYQVQVNWDTQTGTVQSALIRPAGSTTWQTMTVNGDQVSGPAGTPEAGLILTALWDGSSATTTANVSVQQGLANTLGNLLAADLSPVSSPLTGTGLQPGDVIYSVNQAPVATVDALRKKVADFKPGDEVAMQIERSGRLMFVSIEIE